MSTGISAKDKIALKHATNDVDPATVRAFNAAFDAWKQTWFKGGLAVSSDPHTRAVGRHFDALVALGSKIIPLVVAKLAESGNFIALQLYDALQSNPKLIVQFEPDDERLLLGEQGRALEVVKQWIASEQVAV